MQLFTTFFLLSIFALPSLAAPSRNLTSLASVGGLPYPNGYSMSNCPANGNAWSSPESQTNPKNRPRSFAAPKAGSLINNENSVPRLHSRYPIAIPPSTNSKRQQRICSSVARNHFNYNGIGHGYEAAPVLLQAGIQYVLSFSSNNPVLGATVYQAAVGSALSHMVTHPNYGQTTSGTLSFALKQTATVYISLRFAGGGASQGELGIFALNTPSELNLEAGSGGL